ncbi:hypothetical protein JMY81_01060 [Brenneria goodwinii]|uniref:hypothetical protein n=1 Tax=Brenneria goodwinii TaxID=1109412 RepID=UPI000EF20A95|nr:hypothetical protein [Brenneria goodwinii]MCG8155186.1 hypothetical protein [Brenneria goodwinii]MCG8159430.1 hypothetical protein [Brenneria goodwinii]MCG8164401.1 hypothetical protein [Brenneria goodwinii]MCG8169033.1 hypothetical protein [Brenneria goodwinii]MCG8173289.1 hypothetical protein [Brenneria goodwinii]
MKSMFFAACVLCAFSTSVLADESQEPKTETHPNTQVRMVRAVGLADVADKTAKSYCFYNDKRFSIGATFVGSTCKLTSSDIPQWVKE